ncbi:MAG: carboxylating nicotinate-nucleotide diphosphorylase [archaeon]|nr:carboxylating nicotinate-nucleotide diphosphorylase [archaeon]
MLSREEKAQLQGYLREDLAKGDVTAKATPLARAIATIKANENCTIAGLEEAIWLLNSKGIAAKAFAKDGMQINRGRVVIEATGENKKLLALERVCLNILGRMSGVATQCAKAKKIAPKTMLALTRKTSPGFQLLDKKAGASAGFWTHRKNLSEMVLLKENHLAFFKSIKEAVKAGKKTKKKVEIEVENQKEALEAAQTNADIVMLDNFSPKKATQTILEMRKAGFAGKIEVSGGVTLKNLKEYTKTGANIISMGYPTKNAKIIDFSMRMKKAK